MAALSEPKNETAERGGYIPKHAACLNLLLFQVVSGNIVYAFVTDFLKTLEN